MTTERRSTRVVVQLAPSEHDRLAAMAQASGTSMSEVVRSKVFGCQDEGSEPAAEQA